MAELVFFKRREERLRAAVIAGRPLLVGRGSGCGVVIPDPAVQPRQFSVSVEEGGAVSLRDMSGDGTYVAGELVERCILEDGADIGLGQWRAVFWAAGQGREVPQRRDQVTRALEITASAPGERRGSAAAPPSRRKAAESEFLPIFRERLIVVPQAGGTSCGRVEMPCPERLVIGGAPECDLVLDDGFTSACHAVLERREGRWWLTDLGSTNGTFIGGARIQCAELLPGVPASIGQNELKLLPGEGALSASPPEAFEGLVGASVPMKEVFAVIRRIAPSDATVLITGESGTGKELAARAIHRLSHRASGPFIPVNCGALSEALVESELFGHEKGAFTGADRMRKGAFEEAAGGTLFLDEIGELPLTLQAKLLRALELFEIKRVGASRPQKVDLRVVCATNRDLRRDAAAGRFREDLFWRLSAITVALPPLRERGREDIRLLAAHFARSLSAGRGASVLSPDALDALAAHPWPGNVRELKNCIVRTLLLRDSEVITRRGIRLECGPPALSGDSAPSAASAPLVRPKALLPSAPSGILPETVSEGGPLDIEGRTFSELEDEIFIRTCRRLGFCVSAVARELGQSRGAVYRRLRRLGLERPRARAEGG